MSTTSIKTSFRIENITAILSVKDMSASRAFYIDILGFNEADWGNDTFTCFGKDNCAFYVCKGGQGKPGTWVWIGFDGDIFSLKEELKAKGVTIRMPPTNFSYAMEMHIEDPDGHVLRFGKEPDPDQPFTEW
jgi:catechol 2,3-dioxygenase-like lactoylglutathione lyase family enzyme